MSINKTRLAGGTHVAVRSILMMILAVWLTTATDAQEAIDSDDIDPPANEERQVEAPVSENPAHWRYHIAPPADQAADQADRGTPWTDAILGPEIFSLARPDLADVRIFTASGEPFPCAVRYMRPQSVREEVATTEFNRLELEDGAHELTLELTPAVVQHNQVQIVTAGAAFRRAVEVEGSDDGQQWRPLATGHLLRFAESDQKIDVNSITYPDSRFRFLKLRVHPDPSPSATSDIRDLFKIQDTEVLRTVEVPGERSEWEAIIESREPTRIYGAPGSSWILDLQGTHVPCDRLDVEVADNEFMREVQVQAEVPSPILGRLAFETLYLSEGSTWQRKLGEPKQRMTVRFPEVQTPRLRLIVTDYQNAPLTLRAAQVSADARQIVFAQPASSDIQLRLYIGNPQAGAPNYDFARNLPQRLEPAPHRIALGKPVANAEFVPPPLPFTERFPWLIYVVLATVSVLLLLIIASLARKAVALHDGEANAPA
ncbi:MAG: DUF3999 family protein [Planctomycetaceae bacterium]